MVTAAPYAGLAAGIILPMVTKSPMAKAIGIGLVAAGGVEALRQLAPALMAGIPAIAGTGGSNRFRKLPPISVNGMGNYTPNSAYKSSMSVVNGVPNAGAVNPSGSGAACAYLSQRL